MQQKLLKHRIKKQTNTKFDEIKEKWFHCKILIDYVKFKIIFTKGIRKRKFHFYSISFNISNSIASSNLYRKYRYTKDFTF